MTNPDPTSIPCGRCEAHIGEACRTITGRAATWPHAARTGPLHDAWWMGFTDGLRDAVFSPGYAARFVAQNPE